MAAQGCNEICFHLDKAIYANEQNIDIGCMQLNYRYHGRMFKNLNDMTDPEENIYYAGKFLKKLFSQCKFFMDLGMVQGFLCFN